MTYEAAIAWETVNGGPTPLRTDEAEAWRYIIGSTEGYPSGEYMPPLKPPKGKEKPRIIGALKWEYDREEVLAARITAVQIACEGEVGRLQFGEDDDANAEALGRLLLLPATRGAMLAAWGAANGGFHTFLRQLARPLVRAGFTLEPVATGTRCKALILRHGQRVIWLTDAAEMVGGQALQEAAFTSEYAPRSTAASGSPLRLSQALMGFQRQLGSMFGVALHATIGAAALRAATTYIDRRRYVWRPSPLLVTMLRAGHGFRGGYAHAERYDGPAWRLDMNKAYTAALATALPLRAALAGRTAAHEGSPGVYLCRIHGPGALPVYIGRWSRARQEFELDYWNDRNALAVLASSELDGMRALGYRVEQLGGFTYIREWTLAPFAARIHQLCAQHGRGSAHERTAKIIGNSVYGKFAERPDREQVLYALERPSPDWHPMLDMQGVELPDLWTLRVKSYRPGQHVDVAATITGRVRGWLYEGMATTLAVGGSVVHADTDGILATVNPASYLLTDSSRPGSWRVEDEPQRAIVWGRKGYAFGDEVRAAGFSDLSRIEAERIAAGGTVQQEYAVMPAPWKSSAGIREASRRARATA